MGYQDIFGMGSRLNMSPNPQPDLTPGADSGGVRSSESSKIPENKVSEKIKQIDEFLEDSNLDLVRDSLCSLEKDAFCIAPLEKIGDAYLDNNITLIVLQILELRLNLRGLKFGGEEEKETRRNLYYYFGKLKEELEKLKTNLSLSVEAKTAKQGTVSSEPEPKPDTGSEDNPSKQITKEDVLGMLKLLGKINPEDETLAFLVDHPDQVMTKDIKALIDRILMDDNIFGSKNAEIKERAKMIKDGIEIERSRFDDRGISLLILELKSLLNDFSRFLDKLPGTDPIERVEQDLKEFNGIEIGKFIQTSSESDMEPLTVPEKVVRITNDDGEVYIYTEANLSAGFRPHQVRLATAEEMKALEQKPSGGETEQQKEKREHLEEITKMYKLLRESRESGDFSFLKNPKNKLTVFLHKLIKLDVPKDIIAAASEILFLNANPNFKKNSKNKNFLDTNLKKNLVALLETYLKDQGVVLEEIIPAPIPATNGSKTPPPPSAKPRTEPQPKPTEVVKPVENSEKESIFRRIGNKMKALHVSVLGWIKRTFPYKGLDEVGNGSATTTDIKPVTAQPVNRNKIPNTNENSGERIEMSLGRIKEILTALQPLQDRTFLLNPENPLNGMINEIVTSNLSDEIIEAAEKVKKGPPPLYYEQSSGVLVKKLFDLLSDYNEKLDPKKNSTDTTKVDEIKQGTIPFSHGTYNGPVRNGRPCTQDKGDNDSESMCEIIYKKTKAGYKSFRGFVNENGFPHGQGTRHFENGDYEQGEFNNDKFVKGKVRMTDKNSNVYIGPMENGKKSGGEAGNLYNAKNELIFTGIWKNNSYFEGTETLYGKDGKKTGEREWKEGKVVVKQTAPKQENKPVVVPPLKRKDTNNDQNLNGQEMPHKKGEEAFSLDDVGRLKNIFFDGEEIKENYFPALVSFVEGRIAFMYPVVLPSSDGKDKDIEKKKELERKEQEKRKEAIHQDAVLLAQQLEQSFLTAANDTIMNDEMVREGDKNIFIRNLYKLKKTGRSLLRAAPLLITSTAIGFGARATIVGIVGVGAMTILPTLGAAAGVAAGVGALRYFYLKYEKQKKQVAEKGFLIRDDKEIKERKEQAIKGLFGKKELHQSIADGLNGFCKASARKKMIDSTVRKNKIAENGGGQKTIEIFFDICLEDIKDKKRSEKGSNLTNDEYNQCEEMARKEAILLWIMLKNNSETSEAKEEIRGKNHWLMRKLIGKKEYESGNLAAIKTIGTAGILGTICSLSYQGGTEWAMLLSGILGAKGGATSRALELEARENLKIKQKSLYSLNKLKSNRFSSDKRDLAIDLSSALFLGVFDGEPLKKNEVLDALVKYFSETMVPLDEHIGEIKAEMAKKAGNIVESMTNGKEILSGALSGAIIAALTTGALSAAFGKHHEGDNSDQQVKPVGDQGAEAGTELKPDVKAAIDLLPEEKRQLITDIVTKYNVHTDLIDDLGKVPLADLEDKNIDFLEKFRGLNVDNNEDSVDQAAKDGSIKWNSGEKKFYIEPAKVTSPLENTGAGSQGGEAGAQDGGTSNGNESPAKAASLSAKSTGAGSQGGEAGAQGSPRHVDEGGGAIDSRLVEILPPNSKVIDHESIVKGGSISSALGKEIPADMKVTVLNPDGNTPIENFDANLVHEGDTVYEVKNQDGTTQIFVLKEDVTVSEDDGLKEAYDKISIKFRLDKIDQKVLDEANTDKAEGGFHERLNYEEAKIAKEHWDTLHPVAPTPDQPPVAPTPDQPPVAPTPDQPPVAPTPDQPPVELIPQVEEVVESTHEPVVETVVTPKSGTISLDESLDDVADNNTTPVADAADQNTTQSETITGTPGIESSATSGSTEITGTPESYLEYPLSAATSPIDANILNGLSRLGGQRFQGLVEMVSSMASSSDEHKNILNAYLEYFSDSRLPGTRGQIEHFIDWLREGFGSDIDKQKKCLEALTVGNISFKEDINNLGEFKIINPSDSNQEIFAKINGNDIVVKDGDGNFTKSFYDADATTSKINISVLSEVK